MAAWPAGFPPISAFSKNYFKRGLMAAFFFDKTAILLNSGLLGVTHYPTAIAAFSKKTYYTWPNDRFFFLKMRPYG